MSNELVCACVCVRVYVCVRVFILCLFFTGAYKIPSFNDVPIDFRVTLYKDGRNPTAIHSSKGIGEPALFLGASVFFAIREVRPKVDMFCK